MIPSFNNMPHVVKYEVLEDYEGTYFSGIKLRALKVLCTGFARTREVIGNTYYGRELYDTDGGYHKNSIFDENGVIRNIFENKHGYFK